MILWNTTIEAFVPTRLFMQHEPGVRDPLLHHSPLSTRMHMAVDDLGRGTGGPSQAPLDPRLSPIATSSTILLLADIYTDHDAPALWMVIRITHPR